MMDAESAKTLVSVLIIINKTNCTLILLMLLYYVYELVLLRKIRKNLRNIHRLEDVTLLTLATDKEKSTTVPLQNFENYVKSNVLMQDGLIKQIKSLSGEKTEACTVALKNKNINKNKNRHNIPYDFNRVILKTMEGVGSDDYINANYIDGLNRAKAYIVCQGPKFNTVRDFWRMIWQEQVEIIIMATDFIENKQRMCAEYWTERLNTIFECGEITIKLIKEEIYEHHDHRTFEVHYGRKSRRIQHFQLKWSLDKQIPFYSNNAVPLVKRIKEISENSSTPIVIHSGDGVNRSGTILLCDLALQMITLQANIDFCALLKRIREQRANMVNDVGNYVLAHLIVLECIMEQNNPFKAGVEEEINTYVVKQQLSYLERLHWHDRVICSKVFQSRKNSSLNPIFVDGYKKEKKYLITKQPTKQSITEFWSLVAKEKITNILFLNVLENNLWPHTDVSSGVKVRVRYLHDATPDDTQCYKQTQLSLLAFNMETKEELNQSEISFLELNGWNAQKLVPASADNILHAINYLKEITKSETPILLACRDGIKAGGLFAALSYVINKYEKELEFDVCNGLRILKRSNAQFMTKPEQIKFLYRAILEYKQKYVKYTEVVECV